MFASHLYSESRAIGFQAGLYSIVKELTRLGLLDFDATSRFSLLFDAENFGVIRYDP